MDPRTIARGVCDQLRHGVPTGRASGREKPAQGPVPRCPRTAELCVPVQAGYVCAYGPSHPHTRTHIHLPAPWQAGSALDGSRPRAHTPVFSRTTGKGSTGMPPTRSMPIATSSTASAPLAGRRCVVENCVFRHCVHEALYAVSVEFCMQLSGAMCVSWRVIRDISRGGGGVGEGRLTGTPTLSRTTMSRSRRRRRARRRWCWTSRTLASSSWSARTQRRWASHPLAMGVYIPAS